MSTLPDGAVVTVAKGPEGWALLIWRDLNAAPETVPLAMGEDQEPSSVDFAPDGGIMVMTSNLLSIVSDLVATPDQATQGESSNNGMATAQNGGGGMGSFGGRNISSTVMWFNLDGSLAATFDLPTMATSYKALSGRRLAISGMQGDSAIYDETGAQVQSLEIGDAYGVAATGDTVFILGEETIDEIDLATGNTLRSIPFDAGYSAKTAVNAAGDLFILNTEGGFLIKAGEETATRVMNPTGTLLGDPSTSTTAVALLDDGTVLALLGGGSSSGITVTAGRAMGGMMSIGGGSTGETTLAYYKPMDPALVANRTLFAITALSSSTRLLKAVTDFQRAHPELEVKLQVQMESDAEANLEDHIRTLNTDLLAGKGGDVLILDGLPMAQYISRGILKDLTDLLPGFDLLANIAEGSTYRDGKVYAVPASYTFEALWGNKDQIDMIESMTDMIDAAGSDKSPLAARSAEEWLRLFYPASEDSFRDKNGNIQFNTPEFEAFLEALYDMYLVQGELASLDQMFQSRGGQSTSMRGGMNVQEMLSVYNGVAAFYPSAISNLLMLSTAYSIAGGEDSAAITLPAVDGTGRAYTPACLAGINARSKQQELAAEFIALLLSPEVQEVDQSGGLPTTNAALDKVFADAIERSEESGGMVGRLGIPGGVSMEMKQPDQAAWEALEALAKSVNVPAAIDETLMAFIVEETAGFFEGRSTAQQAANALHQRAWFYLNE